MSGRVWWQNIGVFVLAAALAFASAPLSPGDGVAQTSPPHNTPGDGMEALFTQARYSLLAHQILAEHPELGQRSARYRKASGEEWESARWLAATVVRLRGAQDLGGGAELDPAGNIAWAVRLLEYSQKQPSHTPRFEQLLAEAYIVQHDLSHAERMMKRRGGRLKKGFEILLALAQAQKMTDVYGWQALLERLHPVDDRRQMWALTRACAEHHGDACYVCVDGCEWLRASSAPDVFSPSREVARAAFERREYEVAIRHILGLYPRLTERRFRYKRERGETSRHDLSLMAAAMVQVQGGGTLRREAPHAPVSSASAERHLDFALSMLDYLKRRHEDDEVVMTRWAISRLSTTRGDSDGSKREEARAYLVSRARRGELGALGASALAEDYLTRGDVEGARRLRARCEQEVSDASLCH